jgi:hypothetical protein
LYSSSIINNKKIIINKKKLKKTGTRFGGGVPHVPVVKKNTCAELIYTYNDVYYKIGSKTGTLCETGRTTFKNVNIISEAYVPIFNDEKVLIVIARLSTCTYII